MSLLAFFISFLYLKCIGGITESICKRLHSKFICIASMRKKCICVVVARVFLGARLVSRSAGVEDSSRFAENDRAKH